jgi:hypothetical protein
LGRFFRDRVNHLGNHVSGALNDDCVTHADVLAGDFIFIVECRIGDNDTTDRDWFETSYRGQGPGASHLDVDPIEDGRGLFGRKLVSNRPAGCPTNKAQTSLQIDPVYFVDDTVNVVVEGRALISDIPIETQNILETVTQACDRVCPGSPNPRWSPENPTGCRQRRR